jgi:hypothetical protein
MIKVQGINTFKIRSIYINCGMDDSESLYSVKHKRPSK